MKFRSTVLLCLLIIGNVALAQNNHTWKKGASGGYTYRYVTNDPTQSRFYTLKNGLTVILSQNNKDPRITYKMAVRAGSNHDPSSNTGLAHYLEHLLFKGTDKYGTLDFAKEKPLLDRISALYETYNKTTDPAKRKEIYQEIDRVSGEASNYSIANEYDRLMKSIGSIGTNAHTSVEETVYDENIPSNTIDKFLAIQAERFRSPVFRIFHTELEAVYEEKNRSLDNDRFKMYEGMSKALFPTHNYGQQTTIGTIEHLKNPSLVEIRKYYNKYYVPNNMALIMAGDINYDELIEKIDKSFSYMVAKPLNQYNPAPEKPLTQVQNVDVYGPSAESLYIAYRGFANNTRHSLILDLIANILSNGEAGLMDININKQQKMLSAGAGYNSMKDYGMFVLVGSPKTGQNLQDAEKLLLEQVALLKSGDFDESLIKATVSNIKLAELKGFESNNSRAYAAMIAFIQNRGTAWDKILSSADDMSKITKKEVVDFANKFFVDNYVAVYKHAGEDKNIVKVEKPAITAVKTNSNEVSPFVKSIMEQPTQPIAPKFLDYTKDLKFGKAGIADVITVQNDENGIFRMNYRFEMGSYHNKLLPYAAEYLGFLATDKMSSEEISRAFYNLACSYSVNVGTDVTTVSLSGLQENFDNSVALLESILANCKPNEKALEDLKGRILKTRENAKLNKAVVLDGLMSYAQYGKDNPFNYKLTDQEIKNLKSSDLIDILRNLTKYEHQITYYGPQTLDAFSSTMTKVHPLGKTFTEMPAMKKFKYVKTDSNKVYFANYDMVQAEIRWVRNSGAFNASDASKIALFNNYFGGGMGSIVFQTIRESKALAYSTYAYYVAPTSKEKENAAIAYVGAQADKMKDAIVAMNELLSVLPESEKLFALAKSNTLNGIETTRITRDGIISAYFADKKLGYDKDSRIEKYEGLKPLTLSDIKSFHKSSLSDKPYSYCIVASEKRVNLEDLAKVGEVHKLSLEQIFGY